MYISYTEEVKKDCFNAAVISGNINFKEIVFKKYLQMKIVLFCLSTIRRKDC